MVISYLEQKKQRSPNATAAAAAIVSNYAKTKLEIQIFFVQTLSWNASAIVCFALLLLGAFSNGTGRPAGKELVPHCWFT